MKWGGNGGDEKILEDWTNGGGDLEEDGDGVGAFWGVLKRVFRALEVFGSGFFVGGSK